jgi:molybdate transport system ATP-binding protein
VLRIEARTRLGELELDVALEVPAGDCLALAGPSGAGKTSVLRVASGLLRPESGRVECGGETWLDTERGLDVPPEDRRCGYVFQEYALFPHLTTWQNVAYPLRGMKRPERRRRAQELLERFGVGKLADARPRTLSGGERQRVAVARVLARRPGVLLLDEPLSALDARTRAGAARELESVLREIEVPALLVTHDFAEAAQLGDRVGVIDAGRVVQEGTATELAAAPRSAFVADFAGAVVLTGRARGGANGLTHVELDGGGAVTSTDRGEGPVAVSVYPWEITIGPEREAAHGSAQNRLVAEILSITTVGEGSGNTTGNDLRRIR